MGEKYLKDKDFSDFKDRSYQSCVETLHLSSWDEFHKVIKIFFRHIDNSTDRYADYYIWRGQKEDLPLISNFYRKYKDLKKEDRKNELIRILSTFKKRLSDLPNTLIDFRKLEDEDTIWTIGQHYGLITPLLDWTEVPYYAAYFAFYEKFQNKKEDRIVYALNLPEILRFKLKLKHPITKEVLEIKQFNFDRKFISPEQNQRLINQKGTFTRDYENFKVENALQKIYESDTKNNPEKEKNYSKVVLTKILIPEKLQDECLSSLKSMNITHGSLFPDYAGAVEISKIDMA